MTKTGYCTEVHFVYGVAIETIHETVDGICDTVTDRYYVKPNEDLISI